MPPELDSALVHIPADPGNTSQPQSLVIVFPEHPGVYYELFHIFSIYLFLSLL